MNFANPIFLFGLFAILIPIVIHLFNFRRYKTVYFSNVKMLQDIMQKTRRKSQLQHIIALILRILAICSLVFAFAQPYLKVEKDESSHNGHLVTLFLDNSFSMSANAENGPLLQTAIDDAKGIVNAFTYSDEFILVTQDFSSKHSHVMNKEEILTMLDEIETSPNHRTTEEMLAIRDNIATEAHHGKRMDYFISDFQKSGFQWNRKERSGKTFLLPITAAEVNNVAIDTCWFSAPVFKSGQEITLNVRVHNYGENDVLKLPLKLYVNKTQQALAAVDLKAHSYSDLQLRYTIHGEGIQCGIIEINDAPIQFDDKFYFVYEVTSATNIIAIQENNSNRYLKAMYGYDSLFVYSEMNKDHINYSQFKESQLIILDQLKDISSGLADELKKFIESGGNLLVFPNQEMNLDHFGAFLNSIGGGNYTKQNAAALKAGKIDWESIYFKDAVQKQSGKMDMPTILNHFGITENTTNSTEVIMRLENNEPLLTVTQTGKGKLFLSAVALDDFFGDAHRNALFFIPLHNIGIKSQGQGKLYNIIGKDNEQTIAKKTQSADDVFTLKSQKSGAEFIPGQKSIGNETRIFFHSQVAEAGLYDLLQGSVPYSTFAFNFGSEESELTYYDNDELQDIIGDDGQVSVISGDAKNITEQITQNLNGKPLWRYFIYFALLCILAEIIVLRFWNKKTTGGQK